MKALTAIIIGLGHQTRNDHIPAILRRKDLEVIAFVDTNTKILKTYESEFGIKGFTDITTALATVKPDIAIVSVPHNQYYNILEVLAKNHIATLKEKPLAMNYVEAKKIVDLYRMHDTYLQICVQRRFSKLYDQTKEFLKEIGKVYSIYIEYTLNLSAKDMASGWRADKRISGGGAALDMGYHSIDLLTYIFGLPDKVYAQLNYNSIGKGYTIDDTMKAMMTYNKGHINANIVVTKVFFQKNEKVRIFGSEGSVYVDGRKVTLYDKEAHEVETHSFTSKDEELDAQLDYFVTHHTASTPETSALLADQLSDMLIIDSIYKSHGEEKVIKIGRRK